MRIVHTFAVMTAFGLGSNLSAQVVARAAPRSAASPQIEAAIRAVPRPVLVAQRQVKLYEDPAGSFTPANLKGLREQDLAKGRVIGVAKLSASNKLGVPAGQYDYVLVRSDNQWHLFAVSGGRVIKEARFVVTQPPTSGSSTPATTSGPSTTSDAGQETLGRLVVSPSSIELPYNAFTGLRCGDPNYTVRVQVKAERFEPKGSAQESHQRKLIGPPDAVQFQVAPMRYNVQPLVTAIGMSWADLSVQQCVFPSTVTFTAPGYLPAILPIHNQGLDGPIGLGNDTPSISWGW